MHKGFWQELVPENLPNYCAHCYRQGHTEDKCYDLRPNLRPAKLHMGETGEAGFHPKVEFRCKLGDTSMSLTTQRKNDSLERVADGESLPSATDMASRSNRQLDGEITENNTN